MRSSRYFRAEDRLSFVAERVDDFESRRECEEREMEQRFAGRKLRLGCSWLSFSVLAAIQLALGAGVVRGQSGQRDGAGWTGETHAEEIVAARSAVMLEMERLMRPLDAHAAGEPGNPDLLREAAGTISTFLLTVPHLFPPTTNLYDPNAETPATLARPEIWEDFSSFHSLADAAAAAAADTLTASAAELPQAAARLREACDACHTRFMRTYSPPTVTEEDLEFDFESLFPAE
nr:hypothetical protein [Gammaproteobacteria bacterium]